jgi:hypothetical protein
MDEFVFSWFMAKSPVQVRERCSRWDENIALVTGFGKDNPVFT